MLLDDLKDRIAAPSWLSYNCMYLTRMGSVAYGCAGESSDWDMYGFCIPPKDLVFPHLKGEIPGFGTQLKRFNQWQQHRVCPDVEGVPVGITLEMVNAELEKRGEL